MQNSTAKFLQENILYVGLGIGLLVIAILAVAFALGSSDPDDNTQVVLNNAGECPEVTLTLTNLADGTIIEIKAKAGERKSAKVEPGTAYSYLLDTNSEPDESGMRCYNIDEGTIADVPAGRSVTINVPSIRSTPTPDGD